MKKFTIFLTTFLLILVCTTTSMATNKMSIEASKTELNAGDEFTVLVNFDSEKENIYAYTAKLTYDQNVFEIIDKEDFEEQENWSDITYNSNNNKFALINKKGEKSENILKINFKVKEDAIPGETTIDINNASASDSNETIKLENAETKVMINNDAPNEAEDSSEIKDNFENTNEDDISIHTEKTFPWLGTVCLILCALVIYIVIRILTKNKIEKRWKYIIATASIISIVILLIIAFRDIFYRKSDINVDGIIDYKDSSDLIEYILEINKADEEELTELDVNDDAVIDVTDVAETVHDAGNQHYNANVNSGNNGASSSENSNISREENYLDITQDQTEYNKTPEKGEEIVLDLHIEITPDTEVEAVTIGDKIYPVEKVGENNYKVKISTPEKAGKQELVIDGVVLDNGKKVKTKYQVTIDVLKDKPIIDNLGIHTKDDGSEISFNVIDPDGAMKNGQIIVMDMKGNIAFESQDIVNGNNIFNILNLSKEENYKLKIKLDYDLDDDIYGKPEDNRGTVSIGEIEFKLDTDYETEELEVYEIKAKTTNKGITKYINKNEKYKIYFEAKPKIGNGKISYPKYIRIADEHKTKKERTYELENNKNIYTTIQEFEGYKDKGKKEITIESIILDDGTEEPLNRNLQIEVLKDKPTLENYEVRDIQPTTVVFDIKDDDGAFQSGNLTINNQGEIIQKPINVGHNEIPLENIKESCTIMINCLYNLDEEDNQNSGMATLKMDTINIIRAPFIKEGNLKAEIIEKNKVKATFTIENADSCTKLQALLIDKDGTILETVDLENTANEVIFNSVIQALNEYTVKIIASYNLNNGEVKNDVELGATTVKINLEAFISNIQVNEFAKKEEIVEVLFDVNANVALDVTDLKIKDESGNDVEILNLEKQENQRYMAIIKANSISGKTTYKITRLFYGNESVEINENNSFTITVLKNVPTITEYKHDNNADKIIIMFKVNDEENAIKEGTAIVKSDNNTLKVIPLQNGNMTIEVAKSEITGNNCTLSIEGTYDLGDGIERQLEFKDMLTEIITKVTEITPDTVIKEKGETLNISVTVEDNTDLKIHKFIFVDINNPEKKIEHTVIGNEGDTYNLQAVLGSDAGETIYKVAEVEYENVLQPIKVSDSKTIKVDLLKDKPQVEFIYDESEDTPKLLVNVKDKDNAIIEGTLAIVETPNFTESDDNLSNALTSITIEKDKENYEFDLQNLELKEKASHTAFAFGQYDLDSDNSNDQNAHMLMETFHFLHISNYDIKLEKVAVEKVDRENKKVTITFESTNATTDSELATKYHVKQVEINGKIYDAELVEGNKYKVEIPYESNETTEFSITKIVLDNNKAEEFEEGKYKVKIFKKVPIIEQVDVSIDLSGIVTANYELQDEDNTVSKLYATLKNPSGETLIENKEIETIKSGSISFDGISATDCGKYTVEINADYNLSDGYTYEKRLLGSGYSEIEIIADITNADCKTKYVEKENDIEITYTITDNIKADDREAYAVKAVEIAKKVGDSYEDTHTYQVKEQEEKNTYVVTIPAPNTAGKITYVPLKIIYIDNATSVEYSSSTDVETYDLETEIEVLKSKPEIINYSLNDNYVTFDLKDEDNAFESGTITVTDAEGTVTITKELSKSEQNKISLADLKNSTHTLKVTATYNLDEDKTAENQHNNEEIYTNEIEVVNDYRLEFNDLKIDRIEKGENKKAYISFVSLNAINSPVKSVKVNGVIYPVNSDDENKYIVELPYETEDTKTSYEFTEVTLENGKTLEIQSENRIIEIFKNKPIINELHVSAENQNLTVQFNVIDEDNTISNIYIVVRDETKELIRKEVIKQDTISEVLENILNQSGSYTIEIYAKLDRADGSDVQNDVLLAFEEYKEEAKSEIKSHKIMKDNEEIKYAEKQTNIDLIFDIEDNINLDVLEMIINGSSYIPQRQEDGKYKVTVTTPDTAGNAMFTVSEIKYDQKTISSNYQVELEILKSKPKVDSYLFDDRKAITFTLIDEDDAFIDGKVIIKNEGETIKEYQISETGEQRIELDNEIGQNIYNLQVTATYNLHQKQEDATNETSILHDSELKIIENYHLDIENLEIENIDTDNKIVTIGFKADNGSDETDSKIEKIFIDGYDEGINVEYLRGKYTAEISYIEDNYKKQRLTFTKAYLDNGKELDINDKYIEIFKEKPKVTELSGELENTRVTFKLEDTDNTLSKIQTRLKTVKTIEQDYATLTQETVYMQKSLTAQEARDIQRDDGTINVTLEEIEDIKLDKDIAENYTIEILADYENYDGDTHTDETIANDNIIVPIVAGVESCTIDKEFVEKGEEILAKIKVQDNTNMDVTSIEINGQQCYVEKQEEEDAYIAKYNAPNECGKTNLNITKINYENEQIEAKYSSNDTIEVLKAIPTLENYVQETTLDDPYISFNLKDDDNALRNAHITIKDIKNNENKIVDKNIQTGENTIQLNTFDDGVYYIEINGDYDRYSSIDKSEKITFTEEAQKIQILKGYNIQIVDLITPGFVDMRMPLMISFFATNAKGLDATSIKINDISYPFESKKIYPDLHENMTYYLAMVVDWEHQIGYNKVFVNSITFGDNTEVVVDKNLSYVLERKYPSASNLKLEEIDQASELKATFNVLDTDNTIRQLNAVLKDANGNIANTVEVKLDESNPEEQEKEVIFEGTPITSRYTVELQAIYDLVKYNDDYVKEMTLAKSSITAKTRAVIRACTPSNTYPAKGENVKLKYVIEHNLPEHTYITGVVVNGETQTLNNTAGNNYELNIKVPNDDGKVDYVTSDILYTTGAYTMEEKYQKHTMLDVLKNKPEVTNYRVNDNFKEKTAEFAFNLADEDGAFTNGYATIDGGTTTKPISKGQNQINFDNIEPNKPMNLQIISNYDLDSNPDDDKNKYSKTDDKPFTLISDYGLRISDIKTSNYYEKNKQVDLEFQSTNLLEQQGVYPTSIIVGDKEYNLEKENNYYLTNLDGYSQAGKKRITIDNIVLNSGKVLQGTETDKTEVEVLKDKVSIYKFAYNTEDKDKVLLELKLKDSDSSLENAKVKIIDESKDIDETVMEGTINPNETKKIEFNKTESPKYKIKVEAEGSRDIGKNQEWQYNEEIFNREFSLTDRYIEMKEIKDALLYKVKDGKKTYISEVSEDEIRGHLNDYILKIEMENMPAFYTDIKDYSIRDEVLYFTIDYEHAIQYSEDSNKTDIEVKYGALSENKYISNNLETLLKAMTEEPNGTFTITRDYDFTAKGNAKSIIDGNIEFTGTINGNGHKFTNMSNALFAKMKGATIKNLVIDNANVKSGARGILATTMSGGTIEDVHITNSTISQYSMEGVGALIGDINSGDTTIEQCSVTNTNVNGQKRVGGILGYITSPSNTKMNNCYENATIKASSDAIGGLIGEAKGTVTISNCYSVGQMTRNGNSGGLIGWKNNTLISKNNIAMVDGANNKLYANGVNTSENNYELKEAIGNASTESGVTAIGKSEINSELFGTNLGWSSEIWNFENASFENLPKLRNSDPNSKTNAKTPNNKDVYIPEYERISELDDYDDNKEILYNNLNKLMPFYDAKYLVEDAKRVSEDSMLNKKLIKGILAYNGKGEIISSLTTENYQNIAKIKIIYTDTTSEDYNTTFETYFGNIATYELPELSNIKYCYNHYVIDNNNSIINELTDYILKLDYVMDLDRITEGNDSRLYRENYNSKFVISDSVTDEEKQEIRENVRQFVLNILSTNNYTVTSNNENIISTIKDDLINDGTLKKLLYSYNYYNRWYNIDIEGMNVVDILSFHGEIFNKNLNLTTLSTELLKDGVTNTDTRLVNSYYMNYISKYTGYSKVGDFLEFFITLSGKYKDVNDWLSNNFNGPIAEAPLEGHPEINWRAWYMLKNYENGQFLLYILTMPDRSTYILSHPTMVTIGATRTYIKDPFVDKDYDDLKEKVKNYTKNLGIWYTNTWPLIQNADLYNNLIHFGTDTRYTLNSNGVNVRQEAGTEEPFHKNLIEAAGNWSGSAGGAYAYGNGVCWTAYKCLDTYYAYTHENAHNQDVKLFMKNRGGRRGGAEDYTDSLLVQSFGDGEIQMNLNYEYANGTHIASNYTPERIDSLDKIQDYYKKLFDLTDFIDYVAAKAFLELTPEQQSYVAVQIDDPQNLGEFPYKVKMPNDFENMQIKSIEDLWDNRIMIYPGLMERYKDSLIMVDPSKSIIAETIYAARWYQPYSATGVGKSCSFKYTAYEMLAQKGYDNGFIPWLSNKGGTVKNDTQALQEVMGSDITWKQYKKARYDEMQEQWDNINYINADELEEKFKEAFIKDAKFEQETGYAKYSRRRDLNNYKKVVSDAFYTIKANTDDFRGEVFSEKGEQPTEIRVSNAEDFVKNASNHIKATIILDEDIDFSDYDAKTNIVTSAFMGTLRGEGHTLKGNKVPIFNQLIDAKIDNVKLEGSNIGINTSELGALTRKATRTIINNTKINNITIKSNGDSIGGLVGNAIGCTIENVVARKVNIVGAKNVGGIIGNTVNSTTIKSSYINDATIEGTTKTGGLLGNAIENCTIEKCSSNLVNVKTTQDSVGGLVGEMYDSTIQNSYSAQANVHGRSYVGGFVGYTNNPTITNCYAQATIKANSKGAGFIGIAINTANIQNNISFSNVETSANKFDASSSGNVLDSETYCNNYEISEYGGKSAPDLNIQEKTIRPVSCLNFTETSGYKNTLNWKEDIWDFSHCKDDKLPLLIGGDTTTVDLEIIHTQSEPAKQNENSISALEQVPEDYNQVEAENVTSNQLENETEENTLTENIVDNMNVMDENSTQETNTWNITNTLEDNTNTTNDEKNSTMNTTIID